MTQQWPAATSSVVNPRATDALPASLRAEVEQLLGDGHCVAVVVDAPLAIPEVLASDGLELPSELQPSVFWHSTYSGSGPEQGEETAVGLGVFDEVTAPWGDTEVLRRFADEQLTRFHVVGPAAVAPRIYAAVGFTPAAAKAHGPDTWTDFGGAWGVLPRLTYVLRREGSREGKSSAGREHQQAWFCLTLGRADLAHLDGVLAQLSAVSRKLRAAQLAPGTPAEAARAPDETSETTWATWVDAALGSIHSQAIEKVVAARSARFTFSRPLSPAHTLLSLSARHGDSTRFAFFRGRSVFLGATPERLIIKQGNCVETEALAGTVRRRDASFGAASTSDFGPKEHKEHSPVLAQILTTLAPFCTTVSHDPSPQLRAQQQVLHLRTPVRGDLNAGYHVLSLVQALHPTPAVGGCPTAKALSWIAQHEDFDRGLYAGPVGWMDASGDGQFNVALRSGVLKGEQATLFAGAGIVAGSDSQREFDETALKLQVLLGSLCYGSAAAAR
jgi:isochorismate synthase